MIALPDHIAVVSVNRNKYSETFIQKSFVAIPVRKTMLYGGYLPTHFTEDFEVEGEAFAEKPKRFWERKAENLRIQQQENVAHWLKTNKVEIVLAHYGPSGLAMMGICNQLRIPLVVHFHGYDAYRKDILEEQGQHYPTLFEKAAAIVVVSEDMKRQLLQLGAPEEKLHLVHYGVDLKPIATAFWKPNLALQKPAHFLFVGRFVAKKAPDLVIQAFSEVLKGNSDANLVLCGDGELLEDCKKLVSDLGIGANVDFKGVCSAEEIRTQLWECSALVLPSQVSAEGDSEGTPLVILEAGACAKPVIASRHGGIVDVIQDKFNGILVEEKDVLGLTNAMKLIAKFPVYAQELGLNARFVVEERFNASQYHDGLLEVLGNVWEY